MKIARVALIVICLGAVLALVAALLSTRPWSSTKAVEGLISKQTPLGSTAVEVKDLIREKDWGVCLDFTGNTSKIRDTTHTGVVGYHIIGATLPDYGFLFRIHTQAYWGFDENGKLVDVSIRRWSEGF